MKISSLIVAALALAITAQATSEAPPVTPVPQDTWRDEIQTWEESGTSKRPFQIDTAWITTKAVTLDRMISVYAQHSQCFGCEVQLRVSVSRDGNKTRLFQSNYGVVLEIRGPSSNGTEQVLCRSTTVKLRERGDYWLIVHNNQTTTTNVSCDLVLANDPDNFNLPVLYMFLVFLGLAILWIVLKKLEARGKYPRFRHKSHDLTDSKNTLELAQSDDVIAQEKKITPSVSESSVSTHSPPVKRRLRSLDTFRGLSLVVMIFVNYGGGGYWYFQHVHWDGLLVADLVMPWFVWIMGTSVAFAVRGMLRRGTPRWRICVQIIIRAVKIFAIGLFMGARDDQDMKYIRIPGVLQRLAFTYLITALVHVISARAEEATEDESDDGSSSNYRCLRDVLDYWKEWIIMLAILALQVTLTYALPVPGCPTGYVGPGGLHEGGQYMNCTGGAARYIDVWVLSEDHIFQWPTNRYLYRTGQAYDPEGILGTLTSIFICFLGLQAGKIILAYKSDRSRIVRWLIWGVITGTIGTILCQGRLTGGWVPLNKNLWSVSFVFALAGLAFVLFTFMYVIIDVTGLWNGAPFVYPGMNSIVIYVCHSVLGSYFPVTWRWPDYTLHWQRLFRGAWGSVVWTILAYYMYRKNTFVSL